MNCLILQMCLYDRPREGTLGRHALDIILVHYLQRLRFLPVLHEHHPDKPGAGARNLDWTEAGRFYGIIRISKLIKTRRY